MRQDELSETNSLKHYGVPGMKGGVRRANNKSLKGSRKEFRKTAVKGHLKRTAKNIGASYTDGVRVAVGGKPKNIGKRLQDVTTRSYKRTNDSVSARTKSGNKLRAEKNRVLDQSTKNSSKKVREKAEYKMAKNQNKSNHMNRRVNNTKKTIDIREKNTGTITGLGSRFSAGFNRNVNNIGSKTEQIVKNKQAKKKYKKSIKHTSIPGVFDGIY